MSELIQNHPERLEAVVDFARQYLEGEKRKEPLKRMTVG
jgi:hypothetical protein